MLSSSRSGINTNIIILLIIVGGDKTISSVN